MKKVFLLLVSTGCIVSIFAASKCDKHLFDIYPGEWFCETNVLDGTTNVTYECSSKDHYFWVWGLPANTKIFTIQNCQDLLLDVKFLVYHLPTLQYLNLVNISKLTINYYSVERCLPSYVTFTNVVVKALGTNLIDNIQICEGNKTSLKSFILKNVSVDTVGTSFLNSTTLIDFVLDEVKIKYAKLDAININNAKSTIKITNSSFELLEGNFMTGKVNEVIISNTTIQALKIDPCNYYKAFLLEAEKIILNGRKFYDLFKEYYKCTAQVIAEGKEVILNSINDTKEFEKKILKNLDELIHQNSKIIDGSLLMIACLIIGFAAYILINKCYKLFKSCLQRQEFVSEETEMRKLNC